MSARSRAVCCLGVLVLGGLVAAAPRVLGADEAQLTLLCQIASLALAAHGFNLLYSETGLLSFGQAAYVGAGSYAAAYALLAIARHQLAVPVAVGLTPLCGALAGALLALPLGYLASRRERGAYAMITLALGELLATLAAMWPGLFGGEAGVMVDRAGGRARWGIDFISLQQLWPLIAAWTTLALCASALLMRTRFGLLARAVRDESRRVEALGLAPATIRHRMTLLAGAVSGLAGALQTLNLEIASADGLGLSASATIAVAALLGGSAPLLGPLAGAALYSAAAAFLPGVSRAWPLALGALVLGMVLSRQDGLSGALLSLWRRWACPWGRAAYRCLIQRRGSALASRPSSGAGTTADSGAAPAPLASDETPFCAAAPDEQRGDLPLAIEVRAVRLQVGATSILRGVDMQAARGECVVLIGPNGAGKTSLFEVIAGERRASSGRILINGRETGRGADPVQAARLGMARSFQVSRVLTRLSVADNLAVAALGGAPTVGRGAAVRARRAAQAAAAVGLAARRDVPAGELSYPEQRLLEIGMALAQDAAIVLLDEPTAGLDAAEREQIVAVLRALRGRRTLLVIEHDMSVVFGLASRVIVLAQGAVLAEGSPERIRDNPAVRAAYLSGAAPERIDE